MKECSDMRKIKYRGCNNVVDLAATGCYDNYSYSDTKILDCGERLRLHDLNDIKCGSLQEQTLCSKWVHI